MGQLGALWAMEDADVRNPAEKMVLMNIAQTAYEGDHAEINFPILMEWAVMDEGELRTTLNALAARGIITDIRPLNEQVPSYLCKLGDGAVDEHHT